MQTIKVKDVMTRNVFAVAPDTSLETAARLLATRRVSGAPVVDREGRPVGVITQTDLVDPDRERSSDPGRSVYYRVGGGPREVDCEEARGEGVVSDVMSPFVLSVGSEVDVEDAARRMLTDKVHRLLVVDADRIVGIISTLDVLRALSGRRARRRK